MNRPASSSATIRPMLSPPPSAPRWRLTMTAMLGPTGCDRACRKIFPGTPPRANISSYIKRFCNRVRRIVTKFREIPESSRRNLITPELAISGCPGLAARDRSFSLRGENYAPDVLTNAPVRVSLGGQPAQATYQGVAPGFAGLEQLNVIVPAGLGPAVSWCLHQRQTQQCGSDYNQVRLYELRPQPLPGGRGSEWALALTGSYRAATARERSTDELRVSRRQLLPKPVREAIQRPPVGVVVVSRSIRACAHLFCDPFHDEPNHEIVLAVQQRSGRQDHIRTPARLFEEILHHRLHIRLALRALFRNRLGPFHAGFRERHREKGLAHAVQFAQMIPDEFHYSGSCLPP